VWLVSQEERIAGEEVAASLGVARRRGRGEGALRTEAEAGGQASDLRVRLAPAGDRFPMLKDADYEAISLSRLFEERIGRKIVAFVSRPRLIL
jgi:hypothetical protein